MRVIPAVILALLIGYAVQARAAEPADQPSETRPATWAKPIKMEGVPNLHQVSETLYRSAQPTAEGMQRLKEMGIVTIVNLRSFHSDRDEIGSTGLGYEHIYMKAWHPESKEIVRFLQIINDPKRSPVLVHCQHGADRTGTLCAIYRAAVQQWSKEDAIKEMIEGGYGYHPVWKNLPKWIRELDVNQVVKASGIETPSPTEPPGVSGETKSPSK